MPIIYKIDRGRGLIATAITGTWNSADFKNYLDSLISDPGFTFGLRGLLDLRQASGGPSMEEMKELAALVRDYNGGPVSKCAIIVADDLGFNTMRVFETYAAGGPFDYCTFLDEDEAFAWLSSH
jgi:SpoIIAA-like